jgi:hypothetical protein
MNTTAPTDCKAWQDLAHHAESWRGVRLRGLFEQDVARSVQLVAQGPGVRYDYSRQRLGAMTLRLLVRLAAERGSPSGARRCSPARRSTTRRTARVAHGLRRQPMLQRKSKRHCNGRKAWRHEYGRRSAISGS